MIAELLGLSPELNQPGSLLMQLMLAPYDEIIELDLVHGQVRNIRHTEGKYFVPVSDAPYRDIFRYSAENMIHPDDREAYLAFNDAATLLQRLEQSETPGMIHTRVRYRLLEGGWRWVERVIVGGERHGLSPGVVYAFVFDVEDQMGEAESGISRGRSEQTGLLREDAFYERARALLAERGDEEWCLVSIDLENFKLFNEWYGRAQGDLLLAQIGARLRRVEDFSGGIAGYFGQDDFAILAPWDRPRIEELYQRLHGLIKEYGTSVGFMPAFGVAPAEPSCTVEELWDRAAVAARRAKDNYHTRIRVFEPSMIRQTEQDYHILSDFQKALRDHELFIQLQPQCRISNGKVVGAESLVRWRKETGETVSPGMFVPVLERYGFVTDLDKYVWDEVCAWQKRWIDGGHTPLPISVNVSQIDIYTIDVPLHFEHLLEKYGLPVDVLKIEITESAYVDNGSVADAVRRLREQGFLVLMDDFGSGYSSLNMLRNLNVDIIKLDAQFLRMSGDDRRKGLQIMETIVNMAKTMGVPIIVEGVETKDETGFLMGLGCRYVQGYYFYRPMSVEDFEKLISDPERIDTRGFRFKTREQFHLREILDQSVFSDSMLNNILGPVAFYTLHDGELDITRYNQQFRHEAKIPNFAKQTNSIQRFVVEEDVPALFKLLDQAVREPLSGAGGVVRFGTPDGASAQVRMHFFFLEETEEGKKFCGSIHDMTQYAALNDQMRLLSLLTPDTVVFLHRQEGELGFRVVVNGLEDVLGLSGTALEQELHDGIFRERIDPMERETLLQEIVESGMRMAEFSAPFSFSAADGSTVPLRMKFNVVHDRSSGVEYILILRKCA